MFSMHVACNMHTTLYSQYCDMHVCMEVACNMHITREAETQEMSSCSYAVEEAIVGAEPWRTSWWPFLRNPSLQHSGGPVVLGQDVCRCRKIL